MIASLLWKESREQLGKAVVLTAAGIACVASGYLLGLRWQFDIGSLREAQTEWASACILILSLIAPIWIASGFTAAERRAGSFDVLLALPVRPTLLFVIKALVGLLAYLVPAILSWIVLQLVTRPSIGNGIETPSWLLLVSIALYFLFITVTSATRSESRAAMLGVLALLLCVIWAFVLELIYPPAPPPAALLLGNPFMLMVTKSPNDPTLHYVGLEVLILFFWAAAALWRFLRAASNTGTGSEEQQLPLTHTMLKPLPHPPLLWKEVREQFSVFAIAFWSAAGIAIISALVDFEESLRHGVSAPVLEVYGLMLQIMLIAGGVAPLLISVVLGVGAFSGDLDERLLHFWRGQPIPLRQWFWTKYGVSAVGLLLLLILPLSIAAGGCSVFDLDGTRSGDNAATHFRQQAWLAFVAVIVVAPFAHALSIFLASVIRRTMYATITAIILILAVTAVPLFGGLNLGQILTDPDQPWQTIFLLLVASLFLAALLLFSARHILTRNWRLA